MLATVFPDRQAAGEIPHPTTGRGWLLRLGLFQLQRPKDRADDWVWLLDHVVQSGTLKCLMIVGVRLSRLPAAGTCLTLEDLEPLAILPVERSTQEVVFEQLQAQAALSGVPCAVLSDEGSDLLGGERRFCEIHPETRQLSDIAHFAARRLKQRLEQNERWHEFTRQASQTKSATGQTELAFLAPPSQRSKARFMNLGSLLAWSRKTLVVLEKRPPEVLAFCTPERLEEKFGWLREFHTELTLWSEWQTICETVIDDVRRNGYHAGTAARWESQPFESQPSQSRRSPPISSPEGALLRSELVAFVTQQSSQARPGERLPGSTEILESSFGRLKRLEGDHHKGGFTSLVLSHAALLGRTTTELISQALEQVPIKHVWHWCREHLGTTLQSQRTITTHAVNRILAQEKPEEQ